MEAEQRTCLLDQMVRLRLNTKDVEGISWKQGISRRCNKDDDTDEFLMKKKLKDSKKSEKLVRRERNDISTNLEIMLGDASNKYRRIVGRAKQLVDGRKKSIKKKNKQKIDKYKVEHKKKEEAKRIANLPEECKEYEALRALRGTKIDPEPPKPPVITNPEITLSKAELKILSKSPKFTLRNILDKEIYMTEIEKGLIKEKYRRIGLDEHKGEIIEEIYECEEDKLKAEHIKWLEKKGELIYDFEDNTLDFGRSKPTRWKGNKRISLPKSGSASLEAYFEIRRREASRTFDECLKILGKGKDTKHDNLDKEEKEGLKSLKERVKSGELIICATDKSGRFAVLTRDQYVQAGEAHTKHDKTVVMEEWKMIRES